MHVIGLTNYKPYFYALLNDFVHVKNAYVFNHSLNLLHLCHNCILSEINQMISHVLVLKELIYELRMNATALGFFLKITPFT